MFDYKKAFVDKNIDLPDMPDNYAIEIVLGCNLKCRVCPVTYSHETLNNRRLGLMEINLYREIIKQISEQPRNILLTCLGEPLLHPDLISFIRIAKENKHRITIITNGSLLNRELARALVDADIDVIQFSIDEYHKEAFEAVYPNEDYKRVIENAIYLSDLIKERRKNTIIDFKYIVDPVSIEASVDFYINNHKYVNDIIFSPLTSFWGRFKLPNDLQKHIEQKNNNLLIKKVRCIYLWEALYISVDGQAMLCTQDFKLESRLPYVIEYPISDIWNNQVKNYRQLHLLEKFDYEPCNSCRRWEVPYHPYGNIWHKYLTNSKLFGLTKRYKKPFGAIDLPIDSQVVKGPIDIAGWAIAKGCKNLIGVKVIIDGQPIKQADYGFFRPDVAVAYPQYRDSWFSAYSCRINSAQFGNGLHTLAVVVNDDSGMNAILGKKTVLINNNHRK